MDSTILGLVFSISGALILGGLYFFLKRQVVKRQEQYAFAEGSPSIALVQQDQSNALLLIKEGGKILSINAAARNFLELKEDEAVNLERIAAKIRPKESFFSLCAEEGEARLALEGGLFQARSVMIQVGNDQVKVISLEPYSQHEEASSKTGLPAHAWEVYQNLSAEIGAHENRREVALGLLESVEFLLPADKFELGIWDADQSRLMVYHLTGLPGDPDRIIEEVSSETGPGINEFIYHQKSTVIARNLEEMFQQQRDGLNLSEVDEFHSILGIPLRMGEEPLGSLVFLSRADGAFQQEDLNILGLIAPQMSILLYDLSQRQKEGQRSLDLTNLLTLTRGFTEIFDTRNIFDSLIKMISNLVPVEVLGFLIYDEKKQVLQGKNPFQGLPPQFIDVYVAKIPPNSETERVLLQQEVIITSQASESHQWEQLGLIHLSQAASLQESALIPLVSSGRMLGYLQASNHKGGPASFTESELNMLKLAAAQAAPIIENANLLQENVRHAQHTASLRRIANLTSSAAELNDIIRLALRELSFSYNADISLMFLLEENSAALELHPSSVFGRLETPMGFSGLTMANTQFPFSVTSSQSAQISMNCSQDDTLIPYYREALGSYNIESVVIAPLIVRDEGIGEIWIGSHKLSHFNQTDLQFLSSAAIQIASLIENSRLMNQFDEDTRRRLDNFSALRRIGFELSNSTDLDYLLQIIFEEAIKSTGVERGMILLFDPQSAGKLERVPLQLVSGDTRSEPFNAVELDAARSAKPVLLQGEELERVWLPEKRTKSAFLVPVRCEQQGIGLIALYSSHENYFDTVMQEYLQALAALVGIAAGNHRHQELLIRQKEQLSRQLNTFSQLSEVAKKIQMNNSLKQNLDAIAHGIAEVTPFQAVLISVYDSVNKNLVRLCARGIPDVDWRELQNHANSWKDIEELFSPEFNRQSVYFIPAERAPDIPSDVHILTLQDGSQDDPSLETWKSQDMLLIPLLSANGGPLGLISVDMPADGFRPGQGTYEALSLLRMQAILILESHRYLNEQSDSLSTLETLRNRLRWDLDQARQEVDHFQNKAENLAGESERLSRELQWAKAIPEIIHTINQQKTSDSYLEAFADELLTLFNFEAALITHSTPAGTRLLDIRGILPKKANIESMLGQYNPIRHVLQEEKILFVRSVNDHAEWQNNQLLSALDANSMLAIPLRFTNASRYTILLVAKEQVEGINSALDQLESLVRLAEVGLQNLQNLETANTRLSEVTTLLDFNRKLENLDSQTILGNLLETVLQIIPDAEGAWVGMWDEKHKQLTPVVVRGFHSAEDLLTIRFYEDFNDMKLLDEELSLPLRACRMGDQLRIPEVDFPHDYHLSPADLVHYRQATAGKLPLASLLIALRRADHLLGVMVIDHFSGHGEFTDQDEALAASLTHQAVLALENARLLMESENRSAQMQSLTQSTAVIASTMQIDELNSLFLKQIGKVLPYDNATLWLRDGQNLVIASVEGFDDQDSRVGLSVSIEDSILFQEMDRTRQPIAIGDVGKDDRFPSIVLHEYLSWVGIPMMAKSELAGIIALEKREMDFYTPDQIRAGVTFASQAALSLSNARLLKESNQRTLELDQRSSRLSLLNQLSDDLIASMDIDEILRVTIEQLRSALNVTRVAAVLIEGNHFVVKSELPKEESLPRQLAKAPLLEHLRQSLGVFISNNVEFENDLQPLVESYFAPRNVKSVLMIPLETPVKLQGWIWLQTEQVYRYSSAEIDLARTMANQAAIAMQNAVLFSETQRLTGDLEKEIAERTRALQEEHLHNQTLLRMINQLSISIEIDDVMEKTLKILNELLGAEQCFIYLSNGTSRMYSTGTRLVESMKQHDLPENSPEQEIANWMLVNRAPLLVDDIRLDKRWSAVRKPAFRSVLAAPLVLGEQILGTLFLLHQQSSVFTKHKIDFVEAAARQLSIALNNAQLFKLAHEQADRLVSMLRDQQIEASRSFAILAAVADGVLVTDAENEITLLNTSAETILGVKASQMTGRSLLELSDTLKMADNTWFQTILNWAEKADHIPEGANYAQQLNLEDGRIVLVHLAPVILDESFLGTVSILRDITQEVMVDRLKSDFVANVSHELRTPLTAIKGYADLMLMGASGEMSGEQNKFMQVIRENTRRLNILVNDLLDISHIDAGQLALTFKPLDLLELTQMIVNDIRNRAKNEGKPIEFALEAPERLPIVNADEEKIRQVLMNLVSNAFHYTPEGGQVCVRLKQNNHEVQIDVEDNGIGISVENRERIFERFYRGDHPFVLATAGTGLGLAISKILVEVHGGRIWFESSGIPGEGSVFSLTLPINEED